MLKSLVQTSIAMICFYYLNSIEINLSSQFIQPNCQHQVPSHECLGHGEESIADCVATLTDRVIKS